MQPYYSLPRTNLIRKTPKKFKNLPANYEIAFYKEWT